MENSKAKPLLKFLGRVMVANQKTFLAKLAFVLNNVIFVVSYIANQEYPVISKLYFPVLLLFIG